MSRVSHIAYIGSQFRIGRGGAVSYKFCLSILIEVTDLFYPVINKFVPCLLFINIYKRTHIVLNSQNEPKFMFKNNIFTYWEMAGVTVPGHIRFFVFSRQVKNMYFLK